MQDFWNIVGALSGWAGAVATFAAVIVSLRLARGDAAKLIVSAHSQAFVPGPTWKIRVVISNIGRRQVKLREVYFLVQSKKMELSPYLRLHHMNIEAVLAEGDSISMDLEYESVIDYLNKLFDFNKLVLKRASAKIMIGVIGVTTEAKAPIDKKMQEDLLRYVKLATTPI